MKAGDKTGEYHCFINDIDVNGFEERSVSIICNTINTIELIDDIIKLRISVIEYCCSD